MIDRAHELPLVRQAELLRLSRSSLYYAPRPVPAAALAIMRRIDALHLDYPFAGSRMLRDLLRGEAIGGAVLTRGAFLLHQRLDVAVLLDLCVAVVAARMAGEHRAAIDDAYLMRIGEHRQHATNVRVRHRIGVQIEADIGRLADRDRDVFEQRRRVVRQRQ